jgi:hypothetical protein
VVESGIPETPSGLEVLMPVATRFHPGLRLVLALPVLVENPFSGLDLAGPAQPASLATESRFAVSLGLGLLAFQAWFSGKPTAGMF